MDLLARDLLHVEPGAWPGATSFEGGSRQKVSTQVLRAIGGLDSSNPLVRQSPLGDRGGYGH